MNTHAQPLPIFRTEPARLVAPTVLRVVHSIRRDQALRTFEQRKTRVPKELYNHQLSAWERDYLNWYHGDPLKKSLVQAHKRSQNHRAEVMASTRCGCYHCGERFPPQAITEWAKDAQSGTAFCPYCDIDAVIGDASGYPITAEFLEPMKLRWFGED
jgi:hypothetical protein